eukprot:scaffold107945_cov63-Phaeocystis_antarctica.AAC.1
MQRASALNVAHRAVAHVELTVLDHHRCDAEGGRAALECHTLQLEQQPCAQDYCRLDGASVGTQPSPRTGEREADHRTLVSNDADLASQYQIVELYWLGEVVHASRQNELQHDASVAFGAHYAHDLIQVDATVADSDGLLRRRRRGRRRRGWRGG